MPPRKGSFLFLQGPLSPFFEELAQALAARGHRVRKVNLHLGDTVFWRLPATNFRGRFDEWREFIGAVFDAHDVTHLIFLGDRRPYHRGAVAEARARGIAVICTDFGYLRPDWITLEYDGMTTHSRFPRDLEAIRALAHEFPPPDLASRYPTPFSLLAAYDVAVTVPQVLGRPLFPHYRWHGIFHPFAEYAGWLGTLPRRRLRARASAAARADLQAQPGSYFLLPLQLATDFQIRAHSPFADLCLGVRTIVGSFLGSGSARRLAVSVHPLDNGLIDWHGLVRDLAPPDRVVVLDGGTPDALLAGAAGVATVNSTVGLAALRCGVPATTLGDAIYDVPGLADQRPLDAFWHDPIPPDPALVVAFVRALAGATQIKGGFHHRAARTHAIAEIVPRLEHGLYPLPVPSAAELARRRRKTAAAREPDPAPPAGGLNPAPAGDAS